MNPDSAQWMVPLGIAVFSVLGTINGFILNGISERLKRIEKKQDLTQTKDECIRARDTCQKIADGREERDNQEHCELWNALNKHSHQPGLPAGAKVTR